MAKQLAFLFCSLLLLTLADARAYMRATPNEHPHYLTVVNGDGDGNYLPGRVVSILATPPTSEDPSERPFEFVSWIQTSGDGHLADSTSSNTTFTMGYEHAEVVAVFARLKTWFPPGNQSCTTGLLLPQALKWPSHRLEQLVHVDTTSGDSVVSAEQVFALLNVKFDWQEQPLVGYYSAPSGFSKIQPGKNLDKAMFSKNGTNAFEASLWYEGFWRTQDYSGREFPHVTTTLTPVFPVNRNGTQVIADLLPVDIKVHQTQNGPQGSAPKYNNAPKDYMASNLFSVWPNEAAIVKVKLPAPFDQQQNLPPNLIKWEVPGHNIADNTLEATLSWPLSFGGNLKEVKITIGGSLYKVHIKVQGVGIISEVEAAVLVPNASPIMLAYKSESETYAHSTYGITPKADAIRHGYWCSLSVSTFPVTAGDVDIISTAHEYRNRYSDNQQAFNSTMDLQNNAVGMTVNHQVNGLPDRTAIKSELEQRYSSGEMYIWEVPRGAASQSQRDSEGILIKSNKTRIY